MSFYSFLDRFLLQIKCYRFKHGFLNFVFGANKFKSYTDLFLFEYYSFCYDTRFYKKNKIEIAKKF